jgi:hypothetical protein
LNHQLWDTQLHSEEGADMSHPVAVAMFTFAIAMMAISLISNYPDGRIPLRGTTSIWKVRDGFWPALAVVILTWGVVFDGRWQRQDVLGFLVGMMIAASLWLIKRWRHIP